MAKVLIVDDSETLLATAREVLEDAGYTVFTARNWRECRTALAVRPDLVLVDVVLPGYESGDHLAVELRKHPMTAGSRIVFFSGQSELALQRMVHEAGADGYIWKGAEVDEFLTKVARHLPPPGPGGEETDR